MWQWTNIAAFSFLAIGFGLAGGTAQAAPQVLGLQASLQPTPMICTDKGCRADLSAFCLQQQRADPKPAPSITRPRAPR